MTEGKKSLITILIILLFSVNFAYYGCNGRVTNIDTKFAVGDIVKVTNTNKTWLYVRDTPAGEIVKNIPEGWTLEIIDGPQANIEGHNWWKIKEEKHEPSSIEGWVAEEYIQKIAIEDLVPVSPPKYFIEAHDKVESAIAWATDPERKKETKYNTYCLLFVEDAFGVTNIRWGCPDNRYSDCPMGGAAKLTSANSFYQSDKCRNPPRGALIFFSGEGVQEVEGVKLDYSLLGHIGIYLGDGKVVHAYGTPGTNGITGSGGIEGKNFIDSYIGWAYPPEEWISPPNPLSSLEGKIVFVSERDGNCEIYIISLSDRKQTRLTRNEVRDYDPDWSPDGTKIVFDSYSPGDEEIHIINTNGDYARQLTDNDVLDYCPDWSPDGKKIAFVREYQNNRDIYVLDIESNEQKRLTYDLTGDYCPDWSPDGTKIAFMADRSNHPDGTEIYIMNADGSGDPTRLTYSQRNDYSPRWSPDGSKIAFTSMRDGNWEIYIINIDDKTETRLTNNSVDDCDPVWSPDGSMIAFSRNIDGKWEIYVLSINDKKEIQLTDTIGGNYHPSWSK